MYSIEGVQSIYRVYVMYTVYIVTIDIYTIYDRGQRMVCVSRALCCHLCSHIAMLYICIKKCTRLC